MSRNQINHYLFLCIHIHENFYCPRTIKLGNSYFKRISTCLMSQHCILFPIRTKIWKYSINISNWINFVLIIVFLIYNLRIGKTVIFMKITCYFHFGLYPMVCGLNIPLHCVYVLVFVMFFAFDAKLLFRASMTAYTNN